jgi:hypothetical protein
MVPHEKMIASYIKLRDEKSKVEERHKAEIGKYTEAMGLIEAFLKDYLMKNSLQSLATSEATAFLHRSRSATLADTGVFREFVIENNNFDLADFRPKVDSVEDYVTEHNGSPPPGVNFRTAVTLRVNRK